jgi:hypothetical protein
MRRSEDGGVKDVQLPVQAVIEEVGRGWLRSKEQVLYLHSPSSYAYLARLGLGVLPSWDELHEGGSTSRTRCASAVSAMRGA